jgi:hypothetical protein
MSEGATEESQAAESVEPAAGGSLFDEVAAEVAATAGDGTVSSDQPNYEQPWLESFMGGKYRTVEAAEKGQKALQTEFQALKDKMKSFVGAPIDPESGEPVPYSFKMPEGMEPLPADDPLMVAVNGWGQKHGLSADAAQEAFDEIIAPLMAGASIGGRDEELRALVDHYGGQDAMQAKVRDVYAWAASLLPADMIDTLKAAGSTKDTVLVLDALQTAVRNRTIGDGSGGVQLTEAFVNEKARELGIAHPEVVKLRRQWAEGEAARRKAVGR